MTKINTAELLADREKGTEGRCSLGVGCDEAGVCYASAHGQPEQCGQQALRKINIAEIIEDRQSGMKPVEAMRRRYDRLPDLEAAFITVVEALERIARPVHTTNNWYQSCRRKEDIARTTLEKIR